MSQRPAERATGRPPIPSRPPGSSRSSTSQRLVSERRLHVLGFALSALVHLLVLAIWSYPVGPGPPPATSRPTNVRDATAATGGMRVIAIAPVTERVPPSDGPVERVEADPVPTQASHTAPRTDEPATHLDAGAAPAPHRLGPRMGDRRLWVAPDNLSSLGESDVGVARARVSDRVGAISDSSRLAQEAARWMLDWTHTDGEGGRWGISPDGKLHLGGLLDGLFGSNKPSIALPGKAETAERFRRWNTFGFQANLLQIREILRERAMAIRARRDALLRTP